MRAAPDLQLKVRQGRRRRDGHASTSGCRRGQHATPKHASGCGVVIAGSSTTGCRRPRSTLASDRERVVAGDDSRMFPASSTTSASIARAVFRTHASLQFVTTGWREPYKIVHIGSELWTMTTFLPLIGILLPSILFPLAAVDRVFCLVRALGVSGSVSTISAVNRVALPAAAVVVTVACGRDVQAMSDIADYRTTPKTACVWPKLTRTSRTGRCGELAVSWVAPREDADRIRAGRFPGAEEYERAEG